MYYKRSQLQEPFTSVSVYRSSAVRALSKCSHCFFNSFGNFVSKEKGRKVKIEENILNLVCIQFITCAFFFLIRRPSSILFKNNFMLDIF